MVLSCFPIEFYEWRKLRKQTIVVHGPGIKKGPQIIRTHTDNYVSYQFRKGFFRVVSALSCLPCKMMGGYPLKFAQSKIGRHREFCSTPPLVYIFNFCKYPGVALSYGGKHNGFLILWCATVWKQMQH